MSETDKAAGGGSRRGAGRGRARPIQPAAEQSPGQPEPPGEAEPSKEIKRGRGRAKVAVKPQPPGIPSEQEGTQPSLPTSSAEAELAKGLKELRLAERPGFGTVGRPIKLETNHFSIILENKELTVFHYNVELKHPRLAKMNIEDNRIVFWKLISDDENSAVFPDRYTLAYDGGSTLYSLNLLPFPNNASVFKKSMNIRTSRDSNAGNVDVTITFAAAVDVTMHIAGVAGVAEEQGRAALQFLDLVSRQSRSLLNTGMDREDWFSFGPVTYRVPGGPEQQPLALGNGRFMWLGMFMAAHVPRASRAFFNIDVSHGTFYYDRKNVPAIKFLEDVMSEFLKKSWRVGPTTKLSIPELAAFRKAVFGMRVHVVHRDEIRQYVVHGVPVPAAATEVTFRDENGVEETVAAYFAHRYGQLQYNLLPVLQVGSKKKAVYFPIEKCVLAYPQRCTKKLSDVQLSTLIRAAAVPAPQRKQKICQLVREANFERDPWLRRCGIRISDSMTKVLGRVLNPPTVEYNASGGRGRSGNLIQPQDGTWNLSGQKMLQEKTHLNYYGVMYQQGMNYNEIRNFLGQLHRESSQMGLHMAPQSMAAPAAFNRSNDIEAEMTQLINHLKQNDNGVHFVFVASIDRSGGIYAETKRVAEIITGVMTQCVLLKTIRQFSQQTPRVRQTAQNILLKLNAKMGGTNNRVRSEGIWSNLTQSDEYTMFVGANISHPSWAEQSMPSVAAIVSSVDLGGTRYSASIMVKRRGATTVMHLLDVIRRRLLAFHFETKAKPSRIIFYRDGLAEGQLPEAESELKDIREACAQLDKDYRPKITFIITTKRHHTRFFCLDRGDLRGSSGNVPAGTMVDKEITNEKIFDFYLCSHMGIQGTSRPARYTVFCDDNKFTADELQAITYNLTHVYCRCTRSVSIPAPLYYAYWANLRAKHHLSSKVGSDFGSDTMSRSSSGETVTTVTEAELAASVDVHQQLKDSMYFV